MNNTLRVIAKGDGLLPFIDEHGRERRDRYVGRNGARQPAAETVADTHYIRTALAHGDLEELPEEPAPEATPAASVAAPTEPVAPTPSTEEQPK